MKTPEIEIEIRRDDLSGSEIAAFLADHVQALAEITPPESCHVLNLDGLRRPDVAFWSCWRAGELVGCGALKELEAGHGEIKSMRTARAHLRKGIARALLAHIIGEAGRRGYRRLSLETGASEPFAPARELYLKSGFAPCPPFGSYRNDPNSVFMTMELPVNKPDPNPLSGIYAFRNISERLGTAGQPTREQFRVIRDAGFRAVINLALPTSDNALPDEGSLVCGLGMSYVHIPVNFDAPTPQDFRAFCRVMDAFGDRPVFVHCAMNMRVSSFVFLYRVLHQGTSAADAERDLLAIWQPDPVWSRFIKDQLASA